MTTIIQAPEAGSRQTGARWLGTSLLAGGLLVSSMAEAAPLGLTQGEPDIVSAGISISYDAGSDLFTAFGQALELRDNGISTPFPEITTFDLSVTVDSFGNLSGPSTITIQALDGAPTWITGTINTFGYDPTGDLFEFTFDATGGDLQSDFNLGGNIILSAGMETIGSDFGTNMFTANFGFDATGEANTFATNKVPAPGGLALLGIGLGLMGVRGRRRSASQLALN